MRWNLKPVSALKALAVTVSAWTMCAAPIAQGAEATYNQKQLISQYLKESGLTSQKITIGQFWGRVRHIYPAVLQKQLDPWMKIHANEMMPTIQASSFKDADNVEQVRLVLTSGSESNTLTFTGNDDKPMKVNGVTLTRAELADYNKFEQLAAKVASQDPVLKKSTQQNSKTSASTNAQRSNTTLQPSQLAKMNLRQQMKYFLKLREVSEAANHVIELKEGRKGASNVNASAESAVATLWRTLLGATAYALYEEGTSCVASGWIATYHRGSKGASCAAPPDGRVSLLNQVQTLSSSFPTSVVSDMRDCVSKRNGLPCNPLLFGLNSSGGAYCVTESLSTATSQCNTAAPVTDPERIINSIVKVKGGADGLCNVTKSGDKNEVSQDCLSKLGDYTAGLQKSYLDAAKFCTSGVDWSSDSLKDINVAKSTWQANAKGKGQLAPDQIDACNKLKDRYFALQQLVAQAPPPVPATGPACEVPGASKNDKGDCVCSDGKPPRPQPKSAKSGRRGGNKSLPPPPTPGQGGDDSSSSGGGNLTCTPVDVGSGDVTNTNLPGGKAVPQDTCGFLCKYKGVLIAAGIGLVGFGLFWWLTHKKSSSASPTYVPPAGTDSTTTATTTPTATSTITPIASNPCPAPNTVVNGVCTAPIYVPPSPPPTTTSETTSTTSGPTGAAIR